MRGWLVALTLVLAAALGAHDAPAQQTQRRIALIIANADYQAANLGRLPGTQRDAGLMEGALRQAGFQVTVARNLDRQHMRDAILNFARQLGALGPEGVGFFYYSGHGIADDPHGRNYLIPVDAQVQALTDLPIVAIPLNDQLDAIELAHASATIVVIDACRNTPIAFGRGGRGLAPVSATTDTLVAFSTQPGETAADDNVYARVLAQELVRPGADSAQVFQSVQSAVAEQTDRRQRPRYDNGLLKPIVFTAPAALPPPPVVTHTPNSPTNNTSNGADRIQRAVYAAQSGAPISRRSFRDTLPSGEDCANCPDMVVIPSGAFQMGSPSNEVGRESDEGPQHQVSVRAFAASSTEITVAQWNACVSGGGCHGNEPRAGNLPMANVNWADAAGYARWLSQATGKHYRLLSEAEWEYADRGGTSSTFWWGAQSNHDAANYGADGAPGPYTGGRDQWAGIAPVAQFPANPFGLFDTAGNVWEWVEDCYVGSYSGLPIDGSAVERSSCRQRVVRGGSWGRTSQSLRSADRTSDNPDDRKEYRGFRVARDLN